MILEIKQIGTNRNLSWEAYENGNKFCETLLVRNGGWFSAVSQYADGSRPELYFNPTDTTWGSKMEDRFSYKIRNAGQRIGSIVGQNKKTGFLKGYPYYRIELMGEEYLAYEVGFGKDGLFLCIHKNGETVAIVSKELVTVNFRDNYTAYLLDPQYAQIAVLFTLYYDLTKYADFNEVAVHSRKEVRVKSRDQELIEKYDPSFIEKVKTLSAKL